MPRQNAINFPARRVGAILTFVGFMPNEAASSGFFLDYDGYWVVLTNNPHRTIGNVSSGANIAQSWLFNLYEHFWGSFTNTVCPILTSAGAASTRGTSALNDWNASKRLTMPDIRGRVLIGSGLGSGLTQRNIGDFIGTETHTLSLAEMPSHDHSVNGGFFRASPGGGFSLTTAAADVHSAVQPTAQGGNSAHNNMQPSTVAIHFISAGTRG